MFNVSLGFLALQATTDRAAAWLCQELLMLLTLMCVSHSRGATYQINGAREVQDERRAEVRSSYAEPQPSLAVHFSLNALQRYI